MAEIRPKTVVLCILDGWGIAPPSKGNAITSAETSVINKLITTYPVLTLQASGEAVGLSWGEMGNSEVGHLNLGSGKIIYQTLPKINKSIEEGSFFQNPAFLKAIQQVKNNNSKLHLLGLVSNGGVHSHQDHLFALLDLCKNQNLKNVYIHAFLDGRDTKRDGGLNFIEKLLAKIKEIGFGQIATLTGRFYAMDRDKHWERIELAYRAIAEGKSKKEFTNPLEAIKKSYSEKIYDEEFIPSVINEKGELTTIEEKDAVIFFNFRADRARQLTSAFVLPGFEKFERKYFKNLIFVTFTEYEEDLPATVAYPPEIIQRPLAKLLEENNLKQLHIAETEKYAHVTFFFNGGREDEFIGEDRIIVPSPSVSSYDQKPEMSAFELNKKLIKEINQNLYDFIVVNFANPDMVGHTGVIPATIKAIEVVDKCLGELIQVILNKGGVCIITADHGNAEELINLQTGEIDKEHSTNPVPFILVGAPWEGQVITPGLDSLGGDLSIITPSGILADVAPTVLKIMNISQPSEMTGRPLF